MCFEILCVVGQVKGVRQQENSYQSKLVTLINSIYPLISRDVCYVLVILLVPVYRASRSLRSHVVQQRKSSLHKQEFQREARRCTCRNMQNRYVRTGFQGAVDTLPPCASVHVKDNVHIKDRDLQHSDMIYVEFYCIFWCIILKRLSHMLYSKIDQSILQLI